MSNVFSSLTLNCLYTLYYMYFEHLGRFNENIYLSDPGNMCTNKKSHDCDVVRV